MNARGVDFNHGISKLNLSEPNNTSKINLLDSYIDENNIGF